MCVRRPLRGVAHSCVLVLVLVADVLFFGFGVAQCNVAAPSARLGPLVLGFGALVLAALMRVTAYARYLASTRLYTALDARRNLKHAPLPSSDVHAAQAANANATAFALIVHTTCTSSAPVLAGFVGAYMLVAAAHLGYACAADDRPALRALARAHLERGGDPDTRIAWAGTRRHGSLSASASDDDDDAAADDDDSLVSVSLGTAIEHRTQFV